MKFTRLLTAPCLLVLLSAALLVAQEAPSDWRQLKSQLDTTRAELEQLLAGQADLVDQLDQLEATLELSSRLQRVYRWQIGDLETRIAATEAELSHARHQLSEGDERQALQLRYYYMNLSASADDQDDYLFGQLLRAEQGRQDSLLAQTEEYQELLTTLASQKDELRTLQGAQSSELRATQAAMRQREELLVQLQGEQRRRARELADLTEASQVFGAIAKELDWERDTVWQTQEQELIERLRGKLLWPLSGAVVQKFGVSHEASTGLSGRSSGIKIATAPGRKVVAALSGEVVYSGWARGLERFIILAHSGRLYTLYGNLDSLTVGEGDQVLRGEPFAQTAAERLHFEVRQGKTAVDPLAWLKHDQ
ncbi:MAG: peptidoglycan DD-metalloendopeptidase family protein [bacterium]